MLQLLVHDTDAYQSLESDEYDDIGLTDTIGRQQTMKIVNEPGLYSLILGSRKREAKAFKRWITHQVLQGHEMGPTATMGNHE